MAEKNEEDELRKQKCNAKKHGSDENLPTFRNGREFIRNLRRNLKEKIPFSPSRGDELRAPFRHTQKIGSIRENEVWVVAQDDRRWGVFDPYPDTSTRREWLTSLMSRFNRPQFWNRPEQKKQEKEKIEEENEEKEDTEKKEKKEEKEGDNKGKKSGKETEQEKGKHEEEKEEGQKVSEPAGKKKEKEKKKIEKEEKKKEKEERKEMKKKEKKKSEKKEEKEKKEEESGKKEKKKRKETKKEKDKKEEEDGQKVSESVGRMRRFLMCLCCCIGRNRED